MCLPEALLRVFLILLSCFFLSIGIRGLINGQISSWMMGRGLLDDCKFITWEKQRLGFCFYVAQYLLLGSFLLLTASNPYAVLQWFGKIQTWEIHRRAVFIGIGSVLLSFQVYYLLRGVTFDQYFQKIEKNAQPDLYWGVVIFGLLLSAFFFALAVYYP